MKLTGKVLKKSKCNNVTNHIFSCCFRVVFVHFKQQLNKIKRKYILKKLLIKFVVHYYSSIDMSVHNQQFSTVPSDVTGKAI